MPLYDPAHHHDACGVGFIADRQGQVSHRLLRRAVTCLHGLDHRGAKSADGTGDGAGLMTRIPRRLLEHHLHANRITAPARIGVVMTFLPADTAEECREVLERSVAAEGLRVVGWRQVPIGPTVLSEAARNNMPLIEQAIVDASGSKGFSDEEAERRIFLARKATELALVDTPAFSMPSASCRTVVYKGLFTASNIEKFYWDLVDPLFETDFAIFHQRYSTNTSPSWSLSQPFRMVAHNGEINTVRSNRAWMAARQSDLVSDIWGSRTPDLVPLLEDSASDSASLDNAFEVLVRSGRSVAHAKEMLIPAAWENVTDLDPALRAFHEYHAFLTEPWDGPAAIAASDGVHVLAGLDRNGLRPARWTVTPDLVIVASEAGLLPADEVNAIQSGQLGPGELIVVDLSTGEHRLSDTVKAELAARRPYGEWISTQTAYVKDPFDPLQDERFEPDRLSRVFGYTPEERRLLFQQMLDGIEPILSMGHDTGLAALADTPQRLSRYFHQSFAQVTNPPMDPIRESLVMSLRTYVGRRGSLLTETPQQARLMELSSAVLSDAEVEALRGSNDAAFRSIWLEALFPAEAGEQGLRDALDDLCRQAEAAVESGVTIIILSDREVDAARAPIPSLLAVGAVHHHLIATGQRLRASIVSVSGEPREAHDLACLIGFGASAVNPYLAIEQVRALAEDLDRDPVEAQENYRESLEKGLLKIMSKMGICTISAYRGSELFEAIGLDEEVCERAFTFVERRIGGVGFDHITADVLERHALYEAGEEDPGGFYKHRRGGMPHIASPRAVLAVQKAVRSGDPEEWDKYLGLVQEDRPPLELRDLVRFAPPTDPVPLDQVEPAERIMRRFTTAAMSLGALSEEAHTTLAEAMSYIGGLSNSGEGGEDPARFGTPRNSSIKQVASGRFGVTPAYLASAEEYQIKMAQGSKPGEGGQLPGHKVSEQIARLRHTEPGVTLISPPPHHDIYSIEDLAQLIHDLKTFKPLARVSVKLVSGPGVGTIAVGVAKAQADAVLISGNSGGTGASPMVSIKHAGSPWELGLAEAHQALVANRLRSRVLLEADGGMRTGRDVVVAALLGADRFGWGTVPLLALGCKMVRQCHENTCPVGIATQREELRAKYTGSVDQVVNLFRHVAAEVRVHLANLGARSLAEITGRGDLLAAVDGEHPVAQEFVALLARAEVPDDRSPFVSIDRSPLGEQLAAEGRRAVRRREALDLGYPIQNTDRAVGTRLAGEITELLDGEAPPDTVLTARLSGTAGQSFGAFLCDGVEMRLTGTANDYVGKGMGGGMIAITPRVSDPNAAPHGAGNACLYGATAGKLFVAGTVGQRFAVRNSGAVAVVEGVSDHGCEYMTGGAVLILGPVGRNLAAGMTGGVLFVWDPAGMAPRHVADTAPELRRLESDDATMVRQLLSEHLAATESSRARHILEDWNGQRDAFWILRPAPPVLPAAPTEATVAGERAGSGT